MNSRISDLTIDSFSLYLLISAVDALCQIAHVIGKYRKIGGLRHSFDAIELSCLGIKNRLSAVQFRPVRTGFKWIILAYTMAYTTFHLYSDH